MERKLALLRAINVGGRKLPMADLRALAGELGWTDVATYIQSGNLVFSAAGAAAALEDQLEKAIADRFDMQVPVIVRTRKALAALAAANPFTREAVDAPSRLLLFVSKAPIRADAEQKLAERAGEGEEVRSAAGAIYYYFAEGVGGSKVTPTAIDRACGSPTTGRNIRTVAKLLEMLCP